MTKKNKPTSFVTYPSLLRQAEPLPHVHDGYGLGVSTRYKNALRARSRSPVWEMGWRTHESRDFLVFQLFIEGRL